MGMISDVDDFVDAIVYGGEPNNARASNNATIGFSAK